MQVQCKLWWSIMSTFSLLSSEFICISHQESHWINVWNWENNKKSMLLERRGKERAKVTARGMLGNRRVKNGIMCLILSTKDLEERKVSLSKELISANDIGTYLYFTNGSQLAKMKKSTFLTCPCHKIYRVEAVGLKSFNYTLKNYYFCENMKFGAISWIFDILSITVWLKFKSKNPFAHMWHILLWLYATHHISFRPNQFLVKYRFPFPILRFNRKIT